MPRSMKATMRNVKVSIDNALQENTCLCCGNSTLGDLPNRCNVCGALFVEVESTNKVFLKQKHTGENDG